MTKLRDKRLFLLDMDGTLYIGDRLFDGVPEFLRHVRSMGGRYLFLTNNSSRGVEGYIESSAAWASSPPPATISPPWTPPSGI